MGTVVAGLVGKERAFDMPAGDALLQQRGPESSLSQSCQAPQQNRPGVRDQGEQEPATAGASQGPGGGLQIGVGDVVALEIDAGKAIDLEIEQTRRKPGQGTGSCGARFYARDQTGLVMKQDRFASPIVAAMKNARGHRDCL